MYENLVNQTVSKDLISDIKNNRLPGAILFSGSEASGKLTAALETARILSCHEGGNRRFDCACPSCLQHKALTCTNILLLGPRDCFLEISASKKTFLNAVSANAPFLTAARYLFLRSIRKLTLRFSDILWQGDKNLSKIGVVIQDINENLEKLDFPRELPEFEELEKICNGLEKKSLDLETDYLYDSIPVSQIRNMESWAHIKSEEGKKTIIIENADRMQSSVRNALLKILEEPPADVVFILLTSKRNAIMQTILSRVRTYNFKDRSLTEQKDVITRVFHNESFSGSINEYLLTFLPVKPEDIKTQSDLLFDSLVNRQIPSIADIVKKCGNFNPRVELKIFLENIMLRQRPLKNTPEGAEAAFETTKLLRNTWDNITLFNQTPQGALEILLRDLAALNARGGNIFKCAVM